MVPGADPGILKGGGGGESRFSKRQVRRNFQTDKPKKPSRGGGSTPRIRHWGLVLKIR